MTGLLAAGLDGSGVRVGVVDSGVEVGHPGVGSVAVAVELHRDPDGGARWRPTHADAAGHGTACAGIIRNLAHGVEFYSAAIFDATLSAPGPALTEALAWALSMHLDVVNLSLGCTDESCREPLRDLCRRAAECGTIIVAAVGNDGRPCYPACLPEVISVGPGGPAAPPGYRYRAGGQPECQARSGLQRVCWRGGERNLATGTSFAAAHITGLVALIRQAHRGAGTEAVRGFLQAGPPWGVASRPTRPPVSCPAAPAVAEGRLPWLRAAALYPFNKEMHALVRGRDLLPFKLVGVADPPGRGLVGRDAGEILGLPPAGLVVRGRLEAAWTDADTLVLGCVDGLSQVAGRDLVRECVSRALERGLHVFSLQPVPTAAYADLHQRAAAAGRQLVFAAAPGDELAACVESSQHLPPVHVPIIGVFGTSSQQGKFTLQILLRRHLLATGRRLVQIGTEPHSELFGMDLCFPMGHASPLTLPLQAWVPYLTGSLKMLCQRLQPDLVVVGCQSGTIAYDLDAQAGGALASLAFLLGTCPDAAILVVNPGDPPAYVADTIGALRTVAGTRVLALAVSDHVREMAGGLHRAWVGRRPLGDAERRDTIFRLGTTHGLPVVCLADARAGGCLANLIDAYVNQDATSVR